MYTDWEGRNKTLFAADTIIYVENRKELIKNTLRTNDYSKVAGYKVSNIQESITFLYTTNEQVEFEIKNIISYISTTENEIGINLTIFLQDLHEENYKTDERYQRELNN